jgi:ribonuclease R
MLYMMRRLSKILRNKRTNRGALDFELPEAKIIVNDEGKPVDVELRQRGTSEKIIEDFMLAANETVAETMHWLHLPFVYRIHDKPKEQKIVQFYNFVRILGYKIKGKTEDIHPMALSQALDQLQGEEEGSILRSLLLRSMQKAVYSPVNIGHFGLASKNYTHFTSPIRRYPDLMVHRLIREYIINGDVSRADYWAKELGTILDHSSTKERTAQQCEYDVRDMKMAEYMSQFIGEEFEGVVSSVLNFGMFVELPNTVEGLVHVLEMKDDYYHYDERRLSLIGERRKKTYKIGTKVKIRVISTDKDKGTIDFEVVQNKKQKR